MAEIKRVALQTVDTSTKVLKKTETSKKIAPSVRFNLDLFESNEKKYPSFNYAELLKSAEKKQRKEKKKDENSVTNGGGNIFGDDDDQEKILDVAKYFELKYGKRKKSDYADLGAGYDESDSFIDNTDAYDEFVPKDMTTVHGGFYVNSGPLEYKEVNDTDLRSSDNNDNDDDINDDDESSEESSEEDDDKDNEIVTKKSKRIHSSSENDETNDTVNPAKRKIGIEEAEVASAD